MIIEKIVVKNYKLFKDKEIPLNEKMNIFVGENNSGKSTILELINIVTSGKLNGYGFEKQMKANLFNKETRNIFIEQIRDNPNQAKLPIISIEAFCKDEEVYAQYKGTNNSLGIDCPGVSVLVDFDSDYSEEYKALIDKKELYDIPVELYKVTFSYFNSSKKMLFRNGPFKTAFIDTTRKDYSNVLNRFISESISTYLTEKQIVDLSVEYRKNRNGFGETKTVEELNEIIEEKAELTQENVKIELKEKLLDEWKNEMTISVETIPFDQIGFGTQNTIKIELALKNKQDETNIILLEEPENNLTFTNMAKLLAKIGENDNKQIFISTHSSYVANKLGFSNVILVYNSDTCGLDNLNEDTMNYFKKLPGYNTLRLVLANETILVEGSTDDLIMQRAYKDKYGCLPIENGVDVIVVDSLAFKRYCDIALLIKKKVKIVTDNDGDIDKNIKEKYREYIGKENIEFYYEDNENLKTLEPSLLEVNSSNQDLFDAFRKIISKKNSMVGKHNADILSFMTNNKAEWALRVFDSELSIEYPEYIKNAIG